MLDYIYQMTLTLLRHLISARLQEFRQGGGGPGPYEK